MDRRTEYLPGMGFHASETALIFCVFLRIVCLRFLIYCDNMIMSEINIRKGTDSHSPHPCRGQQLLQHADQHWSDVKGTFIN